ncbi:hypothetical protein C8N43_3169 [Litoreibacter ponti]|uniref:Uncharacterized protein n=1 Tax=Litoreibacter ponti TaxID=1510457 RepID=A0A2T6BE76_9RHOB|nr:hypothetical protein [Litoreibacter ponti]PTX54355.1 hypothetical protein C8N43_3169 [Litoreibacter ponti]
MALVKFFCWLLSLIALTALLVTGFGLSLTGLPRMVIDGYLTAQSALFALVPRAVSASWQAAFVFYLLFGVVERAFSEWGFEYAGLVQRGTRMPLKKLGRWVRAVVSVVAWPLSLASDVMAVLLWHRGTGELAREASALTLRSMRYGLSRDEVEDVVGRYGRLTYMARPLFMTALCLTYVVLMLVLFLIF